MIKQYGLQPINGFRKTGIGCFSGFELLPQLFKLLRLVIGQKSKDTASGCSLTLYVISVLSLFVNWRISGIDFYYVVQQKHLYYPIDVHLVGRPFGEHGCKKSKMP